MLATSPGASFSSADDFDRSWRVLTAGALEPLSVVGFLAIDHPNRADFTHSKWHIVKRICGHGNWLPWLEREFGWSRQTADNFIDVQIAKIGHFATICRVYHSST